MDQYCVPILYCSLINLGKTVLQSSIRLPLRTASRTKYFNVNRDHEFEDLSWGGMTDQAISFAFMTEIYRGIYFMYLACIFL